MTAKAARLPDFQKRLKAIDSAGDQIFHEHVRRTVRVGRIEVEETGLEVDRYRLVGQREIRDPGAPVRSRIVPHHDFVRSPEAIVGRVDGDAAVVAAAGAAVGEGAGLDKPRSAHGVRRVAVLLAGDIHRHEFARRGLHVIDADVAVRGERDGRIVGVNAARRTDVRLLLEGGRETADVELVPARGRVATDADRERGEEPVVAQHDVEHACIAGGECAAGLRGPWRLRIRLHVHHVVGEHRHSENVGHANDAHRGIRLAFDEPHRVTRQRVVERRRREREVAAGAMVDARGKGRRVAVEDRGLVDGQEIDALESIRAVVHVEAEDLRVGVPAEARIVAPQRRIDLQPVHFAERIVVSVAIHGRIRCVGDRVEQVVARRVALDG